MASLIDHFEYDIFISYRQNDNIYDGWVTQFVENLQNELVATIKANISVYFDANPHDGLLETHQVDESLNRKLNCLIFIPIISQTYCDTSSFAWQHEFKVFKEKASNDPIGMHITLPNGNVSARILPVKIHNLDESDQAMLERELGGALRSIDFVHQAPGVNRPLDAIRDDSYSEQNEVIYRDQINKVANSIKDILIGIKDQQEPIVKKSVSAADVPSTVTDLSKESAKSFTKSLWRRNIPQVVLVYAALGLILNRLLQSLVNYFNWPIWVSTTGTVVLILGSLLAIGLAWIYEFAPEGIIRTATWKSRLNPFPRHKKKPFTGLATIVALLAVILLQVFYFKYYPASWNQSEQLSSIAVMPFENLSETDNQNYLSDGLAEEIIIQLSKIGALKVISSQSTKKYGTDEYNIKKIGEELDVEVLLKSSIRPWGNIFRLNCQLVETASSVVLWGESYDIDHDNMSNLRNMLAINIADQLGLNLTPTELSSVGKQITKSGDAYEHYLKGRSYYYKYNKVANDSAIFEFRRAIEYDSNYAPAWAGLADSYSQLNFLYDYDIAWNDSSIRAARHAVELDSMSSEAYKSLGNAFYYTNQYKKALECFETAFELSPSNAQAAGNLGSIYFTQGDFYNSIVWQLRSAELNPKGFIAPIMIGWNYRLLGDYQRAETWLRRSISLTPYPDTYRELGYTKVMQGKTEQAIELIPKVLNLNSSARNYEEAGLIALFANSLDSARYCFEMALQLNEDLSTDQNSIVPLALAYFMAEDNKRSEAKNELKRLENLYIDLVLSGSEDDDHRIYLAGIKNLQGDEYGAMVWLQRAIKVGWSDIAMLERIPWLKSLTANENYQSTIEELTNRIGTMSRKAEALEN